MTDPNKLQPHELAHEVLQDTAMDQALDWLIALQCPQPGQQAQFEAWLASDPSHAEAFVKAQTAWGGAPVHSAAVALNAPRKPSAWRRIKPHWKPLATAAVLLLGLVSFSNLPMRLQADHLTVVGERQRLQLDDGSKVLLNTNSAFSSSIKDHQRVARLYQGEAFFEVLPSRGLPLEIDAGPVRASVRDTAFAVRYLNGEAQVQVPRGDVDLPGPQQAGACLPILIGCVRPVPRGRGNTEDHAAPLPPSHLRLGRPPLRWPALQPRRVHEALDARRPCRRCLQIVCLVGVHIRDVPPTRGVFHLRTPQHRAPHCTTSRLRVRAAHGTDCRARRCSTSRCPTVAGEGRAHEPLD